METTLHAKAGAELHSETPGKTTAVETGNPDVRVPENVPAEGRAETTEEENTAGAGNPDIRVPEKLKRKEGLRAGKAEGEEDTRELDAEEARQTDHGGNEEENDPYIEERQPFDSRENTTRGQDSPTKPELRHVPRGTWLQQSFGSSFSGLPANTTAKKPSSDTTDLRKKNTEEINSRKDSRY
ncbi:hypothetical protein NDU88_000152 [Pleurodeles waltl]|uniref:Uncharacterized protein n=1 Tax=Pleurodeles waltl TaxID=8319 RepID=A0AAV7KLS1_PLEWA|nr:hypothetical protein NDU88_000176 [Pleurodeles waltl]KAJ1079614.1 hypothetical protein NDU88_000152 [Pleurodeles waltl]